MEEKTYDAEAWWLMRHMPLSWYPLLVLFGAQCF